MQLMVKDLGWLIYHASCPTIVREGRGREQGRVKEATSHCTTRHLRVYQISQDVSINTTQVMIGQYYSHMSTTYIL